MLRKLAGFYRRNGILSTSFKCAYKSQCRGGNPKFTGPKSAFVSAGYEAGKLPRLLFLSLDSGSAKLKNADKLPRAVRARMQGVDVSSMHKGKHWYRTHELAWYILKPFMPDLTIEETKKYFAHANAAKCCMNKSGNKKADAVLFQNCRGYLKGELSILRPEIIVTQGDEAKKAVVSIREKTLSRMDDYASIIRLNGDDIFWLHTYHPSNYGLFNKQRTGNKTKKVSLGWKKYSKKAHQFIIGKSSP